MEKSAHPKILFSASKSLITSRVSNWSPIVLLQLAIYGHLDHSKENCHCQRYKHSSPRKPHFSGGIIIAVHTLLLYRYVKLICMHLNAIINGVRACSDVRCTVNNSFNYDKPTQVSSSLNSSTDYRNFIILDI